MTFEGLKRALQIFDEVKKNGDGYSVSVRTKTGFVATGSIWKPVVGVVRLDVKAPDASDEVPMIFDIESIEVVQLVVD
jgi:hypothetical protein